MKKFALLVLVVALSLVGISSASALPNTCDGTVTNPDGTTCDWSHNQQGPYGEQGVYDCDDNGESYTGYGPACPGLAEA